MNFEELCLPLRGEMVNYAKRLTNQGSARAEDIVQDALLRAWRAWDRWTPTEGSDPAVCVRAWLYRIVANTFANEFRDRKPLAAALQRQDVVEGMYADQEPALEEHGDEVEAALASLPPQFRVVVERYYFDEQTFKQIAKELKISPGTVMSRMSRARALLIPKLSAYARAEWGLDGTVENAPLAEAVLAPEPDTTRVKCVVG